MADSSSTHPEANWFSFSKTKPHALARLFCIPHAGGDGAVVFNDWAKALPPTIEVCPVRLPGRGPRIKERPYTTISSNAVALAQAMSNFLDKPFAFFGHSMGALVSFETVRLLRRKFKLEPFHLFVSSRCAPQISVSKAITHNLPEAEFLEGIKRLGGTSPEALEHPEILRLLIPTLRADIEACETYSYIEEPPLSCSITAFGGLQDQSVQDLGAWSQQTTGLFNLHMLRGGHFFVETREKIFLDIISAWLTSSLPKLNR